MAGPAYNLQALQASLRTHEGIRRFVYDDANGEPLQKGHNVVGNPTIGVGRNLTSKGLSDAEITYLLMNDIQDAMQVLDLQCNWWTSLSDGRARAMIELVFNMGWGDGSHGLSTFHEFLSMMASGAYDRAADALSDSLWARQVQESRVDAIVSQLRNG